MAEQSGGDKTPAKATAPEAKKTQQGLKYVGSADVREITKAQWAKAGVEDQDKVVFNAENDFTVKGLTDRAFEILSSDKASFKTVDVEA